MYQIVKSAEQHPNVESHPFRALFSAYENILPQNGLDPAHDQICLRFLFRLGDRREGAQSLFESFEALLELLGFKLEFDSDDNEVREVTRNLEDTRRSEEDIPAQYQNVHDSRNLSRRASVDSLHDVDSESNRVIRSRAQSQTLVSRLDVSQQRNQEKRPSTRATTRPTERTTTINLSLGPTAIQNKRGRLTAEEFANDSKHLQGRHFSISRQGTRPMPYYSAWQSNTHANSIAPSETGLLKGADSAHDASAVAHDTQQSYVVGQFERFYSPSRTQLLRDAETFQDYRIRSIARDAINKWCIAALRTKDNHEHIERLAVAHDTKILLRQALEHWRLRLHLKKQKAETKRYFDHVERRAIKARDLYLLTKAFTHWAQCAHDEALRTSLARQHVLSVKYFYAWHDITLGNQAKTRRQGIRKFFTIWKQRYIRTWRDDARADLVYRESLSREVYWRWFWAFCESRAPEWRTGRLRRKYFFYWITVSRANARINQQISAHSDKLVQRRLLSQWSGKARVVLSGLKEAYLFREQKQLNHAMKGWRLSVQYAPLAQQVSNMVDWRVAGVTFATFVNKYRLERQAKLVDHLRVLRTTWSSWNDRLRCQTLAHRIDDRYLLEALYKWVVAERCILFHRLREQILKRQILAKLKNHCYELQVHRELRLKAFQDDKRSKILLSFIELWKFRLSFYRRAQQIAYDFNAPKSVQDTVKLWSQYVKQLRTLDVLAKDFNFYFVGRRSLKIWHKAYADSKRQKRRDAYIQTRRKSKMTLAAVVLSRWRNKISQVQHMQRESGTFSQNLLLRMGANLIDGWRSQSGLKIDQDYRASQHYGRRLLERHLYTWIERLEEEARLEEIADLNSEMRVKNVAFGWLHKLRLRLIELKGQEVSAENLKGWYEKRHFHNILRRWHGQSSKRLDPPPTDSRQEPISPSRTSRRKKQTKGEDHLGRTLRAEGWTEFDVGDWIPVLEAQSSTTPLPGYLSTPSKRAARARALANQSTTPAGTPFERPVHGQLGSTPRNSRRGGLGRSTTSALRGRAFGPITEDSPRTPSRRIDD